MKKLEIIELINTAVKSREICRIFFKYNYHYSYHFPLKTSEKLFLVQSEYLKSIIYFVRLSCNPVFRDKYKLNVVII